MLASDAVSEVERLKLANLNLHSVSHKISHDMKNQLFAANELISLLLEQAGGPITGSQREFLDAALDSCNQISGLVDDWLEAIEINTAVPNPFELRLLQCLVHGSTFHGAFGLVGPRVLEQRAQSNAPGLEVSEQVDAFRGVH